MMQKHADEKWWPPRHLSADCPVKKRDGLSKARSLKLRLAGSPALLKNFMFEHRFWLYFPG